MERLGAMWYYAHGLGFSVVLHDLDILRNEMTVVSCIARSQCFALAYVLSFQHKKNFAIAIGGQMKEVHGFVPHGNLCARHVSCDREVVRLTFD